MLTGLQLFRSYAPWPRLADGFYSVSPSARQPHFILLISLLVSVAPFVAVAGGSFTINGAQTYQTMEGCRVTAHSHIWTTKQLQPVIDALINQAGLTQFRVIIGNANWETNQLNGAVWSNFNGIYGSSRFQSLWSTMAYLNQRGISNGLVPKVSGPTPVWMGGLSLTPGYENAYAEMVGSLFGYARNTMHLQFTEVQPANEPDWTQSGVTMTGPAQYVTVLRDLAQQLGSNGMSDVTFSGPDLATTSTTWMSAMMGDPLVMSKVANFDIHAYEGGSGDQTVVYSFIQQSPYPTTHLWASEFNVACANCENGVSGNDTWSFAQGTAGWLLYLMSQGVSAGMVFEAYDSAYPNYDSSNGYSTAATWSYWGLFAVDNINASPLTFTPRKGFYTVAQIALYVRPGANRIGVSNPGSPLSVLAFYNTNNSQFTITGVNSNSAASTLSCSLTSLPAIPALDFIYTTSTTNLCNAGFIPVTNGAFAVLVPASSVFTLTYSNTPAYFLTPSMQNGSLVLSLVASPGLTYQIQASTNLVDWVTQTNIVSTNSLIQFSDPNMKTSPMNYYRAVWSQ